MRIFFCKILPEAIDLNMIPKLIIDGKACEKKAIRARKLNKVTKSK